MKSKRLAYWFLISLATWGPGCVEVRAEKNGMLTAAKVLIALGCLDPSKSETEKECQAVPEYMNCEGMGGCFKSMLSCKITPKSLRRYADAMEFNQKREKECPVAIENFKKAVGK